MLYGLMFRSKTDATVAPPAGSGRWHDAQAALNLVRIATRLARLEPIAAQIQAVRARSLTKTAARLNARGVGAIHGGQWTAEQVKRVLAQVEDARRQLGCLPRRRGRPRKPRPEDLL